VQRRRQPALARKARDYDKSDPPVEVYDPYGPYNGIGSRWLFWSRCLWRLDGIGLGDMEQSLHRTLAFADLTALANPAGSGNKVAVLVYVSRPTIRSDIVGFLWIVPIYRTNGPFANNIFEGERRFDRMPIYTSYGLW
jgi:hypothetical protein